MRNPILHQTESLEEVEIDGTTVAAEVALLLVPELPQPLARDVERLVATSPHLLTKSKANQLRPCH